MSENLNNGIRALKAGDKEQARRLLAQSLREDPNSERAWQWMYNAANNDAEREKCLSEILRINPGNEKARQEHARLFGDAAVGEIFSAPGAQATKKCPHCAEQVPLEAEICRYCGLSVNPNVIQAQKLQNAGSALSRIGCIMGLIGLGGLCLIWLIL